MKLFCILGLERVSEYQRFDGWFNVSDNETITHFWKSRILQILNGVRWEVDSIGMRPANTRTASTDWTLPCLRHASFRVIDNWLLLHIKYLNLRVDVQRGIRKAQSEEFDDNVGIFQ